MLKKVSKNIVLVATVVAMLYFSSQQIAAQCPSATTLYVDQSIVASGNGTSWATAFKTLDEALAITHCCATVTTIHVAAGTYKPNKKPYNGCTEMTTADNRDKTFHLRDGLTLMGGYPTGGGLRNVAANPTTLSGDFNGDDVISGGGSTLSITGNAENAYQVLIASAPEIGGIGVTIDGFTIKGGNASGLSSIMINTNIFYRYKGGGIYITYGTNTLTNNTIASNNANNGSGIFIEWGINTLTNNTITGNYATYGGGIFTNYGTNTLTNNTITGNTVEIYGGGIYTYSGTNTLTNNTITDNNATDSGGGIYTYSGTNTLTNNTITGNNAIGGGGIYTDYGNNTLTNNTITDNNATDSGGGIFTYSGTNTLTNNTITGNNANNYGNTSSYGGGGIYTYSGTNTLTNNTITDNNANGGGGGGIYTDSGTNTLTNNTITGNNAIGGGGIFTYSGTNTLTNNTITGNNAIGGCGGCGGGGIYTSSGNNTLTNNTITDNNANGGYGGGIYTSSGNNTLTNNTITDNNANGGYGGGIYTNFGTNTLTNNTITGNNAISGGGIYTFSGTNTLTNNTITGNTANTSGGGILTHYGTNSLTNNTITGNTANTSGGGIYTSYGTNSLTNNLFWNNKKGTNTTVQGADYAKNYYGTNTFTNNLLQLASSNYTGGDYDLGTAAGNIFAQNPMFVNESNPAGPDGIHRTADDGLRLQEVSLVINAGIASFGSPNVVPTADILGTVRPQGGGVDIGAYEWFSICYGATNLHVDASVSTSGNGTSWATAFKTLSEALVIAHCCTNINTIKVAAGTYLPTHKPFNSCNEITTANARDITFHLPDGLTLLGGYPAGGGTRDVAANPTTLSGDFNGDDVITGSGSILSITGNAENAYHVVIASAPSSGGIGVTIDGFTVTGGNANGGATTFNINGNNIFRSQSGGIYTNYGTNTLTNNTITGNSSTFGGGIYTHYGTNTLTNNTIAGNNANNSGGGIFTYAGTNRLTNNTIMGNNATSYGFTQSFGGGIYTLSGTNTLTNNTITGNTANGNGGGGGIYTDFGTNTLTNNLFWNNKKGTDAIIQGADYFRLGSINTFTNNLLQLASSNYTTSGSGSYDLGTGASGNIFAQDPMFVNESSPAGPDGIHRTADDGLRLQAGSPVFNAGIASFGSPNVVPAMDILGTVRPQSGGVDMGAYESNVCAPPNAGITNHTGTTILTCSTANINVTATGGTNYTWSGGATPTTAANSFTTAATYTVTVTDSNGCTATASIGVTGNTLCPDCEGTLGGTALPSTPCDDGNPNTENDVFGSNCQCAGTPISTLCNLGATLNGTTNLCAGSVIGLIATGGNQYQWSGPNGFSQPYGGSLIRSNTNPTMSGTYTVTITNNDCVDILSIDITVNPIPSATLSGATSVCSGGTITLNAPVGAAAYQWSGPGGFTQNTGSSNSLSRPNATIAMAGLYKVTVTNAGGCTATASRNISVSAPTLATITGATSVCSNANVLLTATTAGVAYSWTGSGGFTASTAAINTPALAGQYKVTVTSAAGCISTASKTITVTPAPNASISGNANFCTGSTITLIASGGSSYSWSGPGGYTKSGSTISRPGATVLMSGTYTVTVTGSGGCTVTASKVITIASCTSKTTSGDIGDELLTAYPNPTGRLTTIAFTATAAEQVSLSVFNVEGKEVSVLFKGITEADVSYEFMLDTNNLPSGTYYAVLRSSDGTTQQLRLMVVR